jgi:hypothetical protein
MKFRCLYVDKSEILELHRPRCSCVTCLRTLTPLPTGSGAAEALATLLARQCVVPASAYHELSRWVYNLVQTRSEKP